MLSGDWIAGSMSVPSDIPSDAGDASTVIASPSDGITIGRSTARYERLDTSGDGQIGPLDVIIVINALHQQRHAHQCDVNSDGRCAPIDALKIINHLNDRSVELQLSPTDATLNTALIESRVQNGRLARIPAGVWPVRPIAMGPGGEIRGQGVGVSELRLELDHAPGTYDAQHVIGTVNPTEPGGFVDDLKVSHLTINGNHENIDWSDVYADGNAHGMRIRAARNSVFTDLEIKNVHTDGILVATVLGYDNNSRCLLFDNIVIHHAGRQGVSIVGGEDIQLTNFTVSDIGRDEGLQTAPRAAIDLEPEPVSQRLIRNITISHWNIRRVGQGVIVNGLGSSHRAENITIENISLDDFDGPQGLAIDTVENITVRNVSIKNHRSEGGRTVFLKDTQGTISSLLLHRIVGVNYPVHVRGASDLLIDLLVVNNAERGVMLVGGPGQLAEPTVVQLRYPEFREIGSDDSRIIPMRINSSADVVFRYGSLQFHLQASRGDLAKFDFIQSIKKGY